LVVGNGDINGFAVGIFSVGTAVIVGVDDGFDGIFDGVFVGFDDTFDAFRCCAFSVQVGYKLFPFQMLMISFFVTV